MIDTAQTEQVVRLIRVALTPPQQEALRTELADVLKHFEGLAAVDVEGVEPLTHVTSTPTGPVADEPAAARTAAKAYDGLTAPRSEGYLVLPPVRAQRPEVASSSGD